MHKKKQVIKKERGGGGIKKGGGGGGRGGGAKSTMVKTNFNLRTSYVRKRETIGVKWSLTY